MRKTWIPATNALLLSCAAALADAKTTAPQATAPQTFGDWTLRCGVSAASGERACEVDAAVTQPGQSQPIAQMAFGRPVNPPGSAPPATGAEPVPGTTRLVVIVPANITIAPGVNVVANPIDPYLTLPFKSCMQAACFAEIELSDEQMKAFRNRTTPGQLMFADPGNKPVMVEFSYKGLDEALDSLAKH
jgi:invasion protein IalB